jgi:hypothetical protein
MVSQQPADNPLKGLFGGGATAGGQPVSPETKAAAKDFVARYENGDPSEGYSAEEAEQYFRAALQHASPDQLQKAGEQAMAKMNPDQRAAFAEMLKQRQAGQGFVPIQQAGGGTAPAAAGTAGATTPAGGGGGGGLGDILGSLMGGGSGGGGLGDILGGLLGGGQASAQTGVQQGSTGGGGGLGDILGSTAGKAAIAGVAAFAMKELLDKD